MSGIFLLQIIAGFIVGGGFIALLTFMAERLHSRISGIIIIFPSTVVFSFFFLALTQSTEKVVALVPATLIPLGLTVLFPVFYIYLANIFKRYIKVKSLLILISLAVSTFLWLLLSLPFAFHKMSNLTAGIAGYLLFALIAHFLLIRKISFQVKRHQYSFKQIIGRGLFIGFIIAVVIFLGETANPFWGGIMAMYPAAVSSSIIVFHWNYNTEYLFTVFRNVPLGSLSIFLFAISAMIIFPYTGYIWGTLLALVPSLIFSLALTIFVRRS
jgi:hypothetical protein